MLIYGDNEVSYLILDFLELKGDYTVAYLLSLLTFSSSSGLESWTELLCLDFFVLRGVECDRLLLLIFALDSLELLLLWLLKLDDYLDFTALETFDTAGDGVLNTEMAFWGGILSLGWGYCCWL